MKPPQKKPTPPTRKREAPAKTPARPTTPGMGHMPDEMRYKAQDALHTLRRAEEIRKDTDLMKHVHHHAATERDHLTRILRRKKPA